MRRTLFVSAIALSFLAGCTTRQPGATPSGTEPAPATKPAAPTPPPAPAPPANDSDKLAPLDLTPLGIIATIDAPAGAGAKWSLGSVSIEAGNTFSMDLRPQALDMAEEKKFFRENKFVKVKQIAVDTPDTLVLETDALLKSSWAFRVNVKLGDVTYGLSKVGWVDSKDDAMRYVRIARSLRQTDAQKKLVAELTAAEEAIANNGGKIEEREGVRSVRLRRSNVTDEVLASVAKLPRLEVFELSEPESVSAPGLAALGKVSTLREVAFYGEAIADSHLAFLSSLVNLDELIVVRTKNTSAGLAAIAALPKLKKVDLTGTPIDDAGVAILARLPALESLDLSESKVTDAGLKPLAAMKRLKRLDLSKTEVTGTGLSHWPVDRPLDSLQLSGSKANGAGLAALQGRQVQMIYLQGSEIGDADLVHLKALKGLKSVNVQRTKVTAAGVAKLKAEVPGLDVSADQ